MSDSTPHSDDLTAPGPAVGQDEWVARHAERRFFGKGPLAAVEQRVRNAPWWAWLVLFIGVMALVPAVSESGYVRRVAFDTVLYMLLALGLNVVVGWGGLLDLGYVAFYGFGAYAYAMLDSDKFGVHLPTPLSIVAVVILGAMLGLLLGLPSRRLTGDYLAIVTLFFLQLFQTVTTNGDDAFGHNLTGGPNGILRVDPFHLFGHELAVQHEGVFAVSYFYVGLVAFAIVYVALRFVNRSRTGRAWRSLREDPLAAESMGMPVSWLKLMSFAFGAAVAALTGTLFAALNASVFPLTFYFVLLIIVYTMVILGGSGSMHGVVLGALIISPVLELLRDPAKGRILFYVAIVGGALVAFRLSRELGIVVAATVAFGFAVHAILAAIHHSWVAGEDAGGVSGAIAHWVVVPSHLVGWLPSFSYIGLIAMALVLTLVRGVLRTVLLVPTLYLAAFVWENVMLPKPEATRYIILGVILVALMIVRPNGLLGERRVEIV
jgi:branched-chain amino acid transport system permease protein